MKPTEVEDGRCSPASSCSESARKSDAVDQQAHALDQPDESDCAHEAVGDENEANVDEPLVKQDKRVLAMLPCGRASK